jgi:hypothetical protein
MGSLIETPSESLSQSEYFVQDLERAIQTIDQVHSRKPSNSYKPSSLNCMRSMYFEMVGTERDPKDAKSYFIGICQSGTDRHERIQSAIFKMKELGFDCEYVNVAEYVKENNIEDLEIIKQSGFETKLFHKKLKLSFLCDGIIKYRGRYYILEIKTESQFKFSNRTNAAAEHYAQGTAYAVALKLNDVMYLYESRDNCNKKAYILHITEDMKQKLVIKKIEDCEQYVATKVVPPKHKILINKICDNCDYTGACKACR